MNVTRLRFPSSSSLIGKEFTKVSLNSQEGDGIFTSNSIRCLSHPVSHPTVETRIKEPVFIRTLRLKFDLLKLLNKEPHRGCNWERFLYKGSMFSEFRGIFKNS